MKKFRKILGMVLILCLVISLSTFGGTTNNYAGARTREKGSALVLNKDGTCNNDVCDDDKENGEWNIKDGIAKENDAKAHESNMNTESFVLGLSGSHDNNNENVDNNTPNSNSNSGGNSSANAGGTSITPEQKPADQEPAPKPEPKKPEAHQHSWVDHYATTTEQYIVREWDEDVLVGTEPIYVDGMQCPLCDVQDTIGWNMAAHFFGFHQDYVDTHKEADGSFYISCIPVQIQVGEDNVYETQHKVEYGTREVQYVDYRYCSGCGNRE